MKAKSAQSLLYGPGRISRVAASRTRVEQMILDLQAGRARPSKAIEMLLACQGEELTFRLALAINQTLRQQSQGREESLIIESLYRVHGENGNWRRLSPWWR